MGLQIWDDIKSGRAEEDSSLLSRFLVVSYADLKKWTFTYRFAFPGLRMSPQATAASCQPACDFFTKEEVTHPHELNPQTYFLLISYTLIHFIVSDLISRTNILCLCYVYIHVIHSLVCQAAGVVAACTEWRALPSGASKRRFPILLMFLLKIISSGLITFYDYMWFCSMRIS